MLICLAPGPRSSTRFCFKEEPQEEDEPEVDPDCGIPKAGSDCFKKVGSETCSCWSMLSLNMWRLHKIAACLMDGKTRWSGDLGGSQVKWAMSDGIYANPSWYPGVTPQSPFTMFQDREESRFGTNAWTKVLESSCIRSWWFEPPSQNVVSPHIWIFDRHALVLVAAVTLSLSLSSISQQAW